MQLQASALSQLLSLSSCIGPISGGILSGLELSLAKFWELLILCSCISRTFQTELRISLFCYPEIYTPLLCGPPQNPQIPHQISLPEFLENGSGGLQSRCVSQSVREIGRHESQSIQSPENASKHGIASSHLLRDLSPVVGRTLWDTPVPFYTRTSPCPRLVRKKPRASAGCAGTRSHIFSCFQGGSSFHAFVNLLGIPVRDPSLSGALRHGAV